LLAVVESARLEIEVVKAVRVPVPPAFVRGVLRRAATVPEVEARLPAGAVAMAVRLTGDEELRRLNHDFAGHDAVTDVLSFAGSLQHLGDVAISWPAVLRQARELGQPEQTELALLCVHGLLHLMGWDHETAPERKEMTRLTIAALELSGLRLAAGRL
jgi:probable rRNA maturation factor